MFSVAVKLLLRHSERTAVTVLMLVPVVALLVSSNMVTSGYVQQAAASVSLVQPSDAYLAYQPGSSSPSSSTMSYASFLSVEASNVTSALPLLSFPATLGEGASGFFNSSVLATNMTAFLAARHSIVRGKVAAASGGQADAGAILAQALHLKAGEKVTVEAFSQAQTLTIVGVLNSTDQSDTGLILPLASSWALWPQTADKVSYVEFESGDQGALSSISGSLTVMKEEGIDRIAKSFDSQSASLLSNWTYVILALSAAAAIAASSRVVTEVSQEYDTIRALGARLSTARALVFYELLLVSGASIILGISVGIVSTSVLGTLFKAIDGLPLFPSIDLVQLVTVGTTVFLLVLGAGSLSLVWLPRRIGEAGESR